MFFRLFLPCLFLRFITGLLLAENEPPVQVRFLAQVLPDGLGDVVMVAGEQSGDPFTLPTHNLSARLEPPARGFTLRTGAGGQLLGNVNLPENGKDFIVLLVIGKAAGYTPVVIESANPAFQVGQVYAYNASSQTILGQVGSHRFSIPSAEGVMIKPEGAVDDRYYNVALALRNEEDKKVRMFNTSRWPVTKVKRSYLFFFDHPQRNRVTFRAVDEYLDARWELSRSTKASHHALARIFPPLSRASP